ncbi:hypothetical protein MNEG_15652 [Monoraphidium neglectum]|uniref:ABC transmembrane type-1 domain-containing protein n=1 Tax=Monoraphidium neglectum TaxID=145388 RepID=A0A0D2LQU0_9CHLO|nr:hypothetical protein MNEG_15652 [Monoraphidium neglectum]KIY92311.1 hypothetical protein MNEG_15652 [Monoraphidium neglectum]|eukprot:XP_013891331.1 hypothetical protein MNEG_15652 [Monoraphidium neglectum]
MALLIRILTVWPALAGLLVTVAIIPLTWLLGKLLAKARRQAMVAADARVKLITEVITGIKAIKLYAWEEPYMERISALREEELRHIRRTQLLSMVNMTVFNTGPVLVSLAAFGVYAAMGRPLTAAVAFPSLALFNLLRFPIVMIPAQIMNLIAAHVGMGRMRKFMDSEEMETPAHPDAPHTPAAGPADAAAPPAKPPAAAAAAADASNLGADQDARGGVNGAAPAAISIDGGSFAWEIEGPPVLHNIKLEVPAGALAIVVGPVGCGKSSLLSAVLGEMVAVEEVEQADLPAGDEQEGRGAVVRRCKARAAVRGGLAYTAQDSWIQNATLRNNILMVGGGSAV